MLSCLQIENVAVIQKAEVHFQPGLNVLTGETGAGKSILIDSINAILGNRTSKDLVRTGASKAVIRASFAQIPDVVLDKLEAAGYERSAELLLSREITAEGKSSCRINGMPTTAAVLRELCGGLININGQHDSVGLLNPAHHLSILDDYAQNAKLYQEYYVLYRSLVKVKKELDAMITDEAEKQRRIDLLTYQVQEIEDAALTAGEEQTLEARRKVLANASTIRDRVAKAHALLSGDDDTPGAVDLLGEASNAMDTAAQLDESLSGVSGTLMDLYYSAKDAAAELIDRLDAYDTNDAELDEIEQLRDMDGLEEKIYTVEEALEAYPAVYTLPEGDKNLKNGNPCFRQQLDLLRDGAPEIWEDGDRFRFYNSEGRFKGVYQYQEEKHWWKPWKMFDLDPDTFKGAARP